MLIARVYLRPGVGVGHGDLGHVGAIGRAPRAARRVAQQHLCSVGHTRDEPHWRARGRIVLHQQVVVQRQKCRRAGGEPLCVGRVRANGARRRAQPAGGGVAQQLVLGQRHGDRHVRGTPPGLQVQAQGAVVVVHCVELVAVACGRQHAAVALAVAVALADDADLDKRRAPHDADAVGVVVAEVEVAAEPELHIGVALDKLDEALRAVAVVEPSAAILDVNILEHAEAAANRRRMCEHHDWAAFGSH
mmetsp:Transcript_22688/g.67553  ORF Transcript_22688/g.67553 Transcript_22688/m.67553 type:complete len:247 (+) Transcript_22688:280-1020(+)